jgi:hypothetical protein
MQIEPFQRTKNWLLVTELQSFQTGDPNSAAHAMAYGAHWTVNLTWSSTQRAMVFDSRDAALTYLAENLAAMQNAGTED